MAPLHFGMETLDRQCGGGPAAVIVEPIVSAGGVIRLPAQYLQGLRKELSKRGALLIYDEAQTGLGKLGQMFAYQVYGVQPDVLTVSTASGWRSRGQCRDHDRRGYISRHPQWAFDRPFAQFRSPSVQGRHGKYRRNRGRSSCLSVHSKSAATGRPICARCSSVMRSLATSAAAAFCRASSSCATEAARSLQPRLLPISIATALPMVSCSQSAASSKMCCGSCRHLRRPTHSLIKQPRSWKPACTRQLLELTPPASVAPRFGLKNPDDRKSQQSDISAPLRRSRRRRVDLRYPSVGAGNLPVLAGNARGEYSGVHLP